MALLELQAHVVTKVESIVVGPIVIFKFSPDPAPHIQCSSEDLSPAPASVCRCTLAPRAPHSGSTRYLEEGRAELPLHPPWPLRFFLSTPCSWRPEPAGPAVTAAARPCPWPLNEGASQVQ